MHEVIHPRQGLIAFARTWIYREMEAIAQRHLRKVEDPALREELLIGHLAGGRFKEESDDFDSVRTMFFAELAEEWKVRSALPHLERLGLRYQARCLEIATAPDPLPFLDAALSGYESAGTGYSLAYWALDFMADSVDPASRGKVLLRNVDRISDQGLRGCIIADLSKLHGHAEVEQCLRKIFAAEGTPPRNRIKAAGGLLRASGEDAAFNFLIEEAGRSEKAGPEPSGSQWAALIELTTCSEMKTAQRQEVGRVIADHLKSFSGGPAPVRNEVSTLIECLGRLRSSEYSELVSGYLRDEDPWVIGSAIYWIAGQDPQRGISEARARLRSFIDRDTTGADYQYFVSEYLWLLAALEVREAISEFELAREALLMRDPDSDSYEDSLGAGLILRLLRSRSLPERVCLMCKIVNVLRPHRGPLYDIMIERFRKEGADSKQLAPLLRQPSHFNSRRTDW